MMCLSKVFQKQDKKKALAELPASGYYWKVVYFDKDEGKYCPPIYGEYGSYKNGWNTTFRRSEYTGYLLAYHLFCNKKTARKMVKWVSGKSEIVRCKVQRKDIINIGIQDNGLYIVTTRFWIPKPKKKPA